MLRLRQDTHRARRSRSNGGNGLGRQSTESIVYLGLAVILFRAFAAEGYMISTGSMAPYLVGYHRQIVCPACTYAFSRGTRHDETISVLVAGSQPADLAGERSRPATICPNCGLKAIDISQVPRNEGDQLLVHKHFFQLRPPQRWEVVVFRHPADPAQAYVKRVVGLPTESIKIHGGDVYAGGQIQRKPLSTQRGMRIVVYDHDCRPTDPDWQPRWRTRAVSAWEESGDGFVCRSRRSDPEFGIDWLDYYHWVREPGSRLSTTALSQWPDDLPAAATLDRRLRFDRAARQLAFEGSLTDRLAERFKSMSDSAEWTEAIEQLLLEAHRNPIVDQYGYNHPDATSESSVVHDLMAEFVIERLQGSGRWQIAMHDGWQDFTLVFDAERRTAELFGQHSDGPLRSRQLSDEVFSQPMTVEMSLFDRQVLAAIDGELLFEPLPYSALPGRRELIEHPVRIGAAGLDLQVSHLRLYRDIHYTEKKSPHAGETYVLAEDEYYVLGDNSPVSVDSRAWDVPAIPRELLIGKPFLVHLPSRQGRVEWAGSVHHIRIPDLSRIRYIR